MASEILSTIAARLSSSPRLVTTWNVFGELLVADRAALRDGSPDRAVIVGATAHGANLAARICDESSAEPTRMLRLAASLSAGSIALVSNSYVVRYVVPTAQLETAPLERIAHYLLDLASTLDAELRSTRADVSALSHFAV